MGGGDWGGHSTAEAGENFEKLTKNQHKISISLIKYYGFLRDLWGTTPEPEVNLVKINEK